jgi:hypothetical protein
MDRVSMLSEILAQNPKDTFARYGLAMEYSNSGNTQRAVEEFGKLLEFNPDYTPAYFMAAQALARAARVDEAKNMLNRRCRLWWMTWAKNGMGSATATRSWLIIFRPSWSSPIPPLREEADKFSRPGACTTARQLRASA